MLKSKKIVLTRFDDYRDVMPGRLKVSFGRSFGDC